MIDEKTTGSYYTPHDLIRFMMAYLKNEKQDFSYVLEPSAGDGRFLSQLLPEAEKIDAIELFEEKVENIKKEYNSKKINVETVNFLDYVTQCNQKYSVIIGNPPYVNLKKMDKADVDKARKLCDDEQIGKSVMQNLWLAFVVGSCKLLRESGTIFFVLPMEFLQVVYAEKLRIYLENKFNTIHIISFEEAIFKTIEQDVCLVYLTNKLDGDSHILYKTYHNTKSEKPISESKIKKNKPLKKWSNAILSDSEVTMIKEKTDKCIQVSKMGETAPGIVTGGNKYFILTKNKVEELKCERFVLPIVQKSSFIYENTIEISDSVIEKIIQKNKPLYLLDLAKTKEEKPKELIDYLDEAGEELVGDKKLKECYKCSNRNPWYGVPIVKKGDVVFFKRYDALPRIYVNKADVHTTDTGYHIRLKDEYQADSFVFCFFNSLTLAECEYYGRYYGGGVCELVPSEFKSLFIPYQDISQDDIKELNEKFAREESNEEIIEYVNERTICKIFSPKEVKKFEEIRRKLIKRRML